MKTSPLVHGTARPQIVTAESNPRYYELMTKFYKETGIPVDPNTSLNRHGDPMICSPDDALEATRRIWGLEIFW